MEVVEGIAAIVCRIVDWELRIERRAMLVGASKLLLADHTLHSNMMRFCL